MSDFNRIHGILSYLRSLGPVWNWRIVAGTCPHCGPSHFVVTRPDPYFIRCLACKAVAINLAIIQVIRQKGPDTLPSKTVYEMSNYGSTYQFSKENCPSFHCSEFFPGHKSGECVNGVRNEDAQQLSYPDESLDLITSNQVFEHIPDDMAAYRECWRTLRPDGQFIFTVPLHDIDHTVPIAKMEGATFHWLASPEFHASRATGPNSVPVFWHFAVNDIAQRVAQAGFREVSIEDVLLVPQQVMPQRVIRAVK